MRFSCGKIGRSDFSTALPLLLRRGQTSESTSGFAAQSPLEQAILELQQLHEILLAGDLDPLAGERVRVTYQLCQAISDDLNRTDIEFQAGSLLAVEQSS